MSSEYVVLYLGMAIFYLSIIVALMLIKDSKITLKDILDKILYPLRRFLQWIHNKKIRKSKKLETVEPVKDEPEVDDEPKKDDFKKEEPKPTSNEEKPTNLDKAIENVKKLEESDFNSPVTEEIKDMYSFTN